MSLEKKKTSTGVVSNIFILTVTMCKCGGVVVTKTKTIKDVHSLSMRVRRMTMMMRSTRHQISNLNILSVSVVKRLDILLTSVPEIQTLKPEVILWWIWKESRNSRTTKFYSLTRQ